MTIETLIEESLRLSEGASAAPWVTDGIGTDHDFIAITGLRSDGSRAVVDFNPVMYVQEWRENRDFIAHSRQALPKLALALRVAIGALEFYAKGETDLEPKPEKAHLYAREYPIGSLEWRQRSMSDYWSGKIARAALLEIERGV